MSADGSYEIFRKERDNTTVLVEAVKGIEDAQKRVEQLNETGQAEHFIFDPASGSVVEPAQPWTAKDPFAP
jgi:hypothetical protein